MATTSGHAVSRRRLRCDSVGSIKVGLVRLYFGLFSFYGVWARSFKEATAPHLRPMPLRELGLASGTWGGMCMSFF
jgi:hypothetical protein